MAANHREEKYTEEDKEYADYMDTQNPFKNVFEWSSSSRKATENLAVSCQCCLPIDIW